MSSLSNKGSTTKWRKLRDEVIRRDGGTCQRCGMPGNHVDHIVPRRLADPSIADSLDNLQLLCSNCNLRKGGRFFLGLPLGLANGLALAFGLPPF